MSRLDEAISNVAYVLDSLMALRDIHSSGNCNNCDRKCCEYLLKPGQLVRYNCPHYVKKIQEPKKD